MRALKEKYVSACPGITGRLSTLEPYWAYPDSHNFARVNDFLPPAAASYDSSRRSVGGSKQRCTHGVVRSADVDNAGVDGHGHVPSDQRQLEHQPASSAPRPPIRECLVVEKMTKPWNGLRNESAQMASGPQTIEFCLRRSGWWCPAEHEALIAARVQRQTLHGHAGDFGFPLRTRAACDVRPHPRPSLGILTFHQSSILANFAYHSPLALQLSIISHRQVRALPVLF